jgi:hypothetical protein
MKEKWSWPFMEPVDIAAFTDYTSIVQRPMDFGTIKKHLGTRCDKCEFKSAEEFADYIRLCLNNSLLYNKVDKGVIGSVYCAAEHLLQFFEEAFSKEMAQLQAKYSNGDVADDIVGCRISFLSATEDGAAEQWHYGGVISRKKSNENWYTVQFDTTSTPRGAAAQSKKTLFCELDPAQKGQRWHVLEDKGGVDSGRSLDGRSDYDRVLDGMLRDDKNIDFCAVEGCFGPSDDGGKGDLICCDSCPLAFHIGCLNLKQLPPGEWRCPNCAAHSTVGRSTQLASTPPEKIFRGQMLASWTILKILGAHSVSEPFRMPINPAVQHLPGYSVVVQQPMDLTTVRSHVVATCRQLGLGLPGAEDVDAGVSPYADIYAFAADVDLIWRNCIAYNEEGSRICKQVPPSLPPSLPPPLPPSLPPPLPPLLPSSPPSLLPSPSLSVAPPLPPTLSPPPLSHSSPPPFSLPGEDTV